MNVLLPIHTSVSTIGNSTQSLFRSCQRSHGTAGVSHGSSGEMSTRHAADEEQVCIEPHSADAILFRPLPLLSHDTHTPPPSLSPHALPLTSRPSP